MRKKYACTYAFFTFYIASVAGWPDSVVCHAGSLSHFASEEHVRTYEIERVTAERES